MKSKLLLLMVSVALVASAAYGQMIKRQDAIWARTTTSALSFDGKLSEAAWATAESTHIQYGVNSGLPGGGWHNENGLGNTPSDPTNATVKFLAKGDTLYVAIIARDKSIGGGPFNLFDGFLMNVRYRQADGFQGTPFNSGRTNEACELFYAWCTETWADTTTGQKGSGPAFLGDFGSAYVHPRPDSLKAIWDGVTYIQGSTNDDSKLDTSYTMLLKINAKKFGYNISAPGGDVVMWSMSLYDNDWYWPFSDTTKQTNNRTWLQCPWSNASLLNHMRVFVDPTVTTTSGSAPAIPADITVPQSTYPTPVIDGKLTDKVWANPGIGVLKMQYNNTALRNTYPYTAKYRSGQVQQTVNGVSTQAVVDPDTVTVKYFFQGDSLYLGFDVKDKVVQGYYNNTNPGDFTRVDGFRVTINDRVALDQGDNSLSRRSMMFIVDTNGTVKRLEDLALQSGSWDSAGTSVKVALALRGETKFDTTARTTPDSGYTAEMRIDLTKLGYPHGRGDGVVFLGITHFDGDSFSDATRSYGTQTWFMRQDGGSDGAAWCYLDPTVVLSVKGNAAQAPATFALLGNYPNPFNPATTIKFQISRASEVTLDVFDILGRTVSSRSLGMNEAGQHTVVFDASNLASGTYFYRLTTVADHATVQGKMMLLK